MKPNISKDRNSESTVLHEFKQAHTQEIQAITSALVQITNLSTETVQPHFDTMLEQLVKSQQERPFYETATTEEWIHALQEWS